MRRRGLWLLGASCFVLVSACQAAPTAEDAEDLAGIARGRAMRVKLTPRCGADVTGEVVFRQIGDSVRVTAWVSGASPGEHGIHIHESGDCSDHDFSAAGDHFNPTGEPHACPPEVHRHAGDLGNITIGADGKGRLDLTTDLISLTGGDRSIRNRAVILHDGADDCTSQPSGNSGGRLACGVIPER